jgi:hypothetical protein
VPVNRGENGTGRDGATNVRMADLTPAYLIDPPGCSGGVALLDVAADAGVLAWVATSPRVDKPTR